LKITIQQLEKEARKLAEEPSPFPIGISEVNSNQMLNLEFSNAVILLNKNSYLEQIAYFSQK